MSSSANSGNAAPSEQHPANETKTKAKANDFGKEPRAQGLAGEVAIVTGASRGIGRAIALALAEAGASVVVNYRGNLQAARQVAKQCRQWGHESIAVQGDVSDATQVSHLMEQATALGTPSILINNAGIALDKLVMDTTEAEWNQVLQTNLTGPFLCCKAVIPYLLHKGWGRIVNISSMWGITGAASEAAYAASKAGVVALTQSLAAELASKSVTVNAIAPGAIATDMIDHLSADDRRLLQAEIPVGRIGQPKDVAGLTVFLASPQAGYITGEVFRVDGGLAR